MLSFVIVSHELYFLTRKRHCRSQLLMCFFTIRICRVYCMQPDHYVSLVFNDIYLLQMIRQRQTNGMARNEKINNSLQRTIYITQ